MLINGISVLFGALSMFFVGYNDMSLSKSEGQNYVIYHTDNAPASVKLAAGELQTYLQQSIGIKLAIVNAPHAKMIALGDTPAARAIGIKGNEMMPDSYMIKQADSALYIVGNDKTMYRYYDSTGTLFGVYDVLQNELGIRWLYPGVEGEVVPKLDKISFSNLARQGVPDFSSRRLEPFYLRNEKESFQAEQTWMKRNRLGGEVFVCGHAWDDLVSAEILHKHPEYAAQIDGRRTMPFMANNTNKVSPSVKYCTTNPGLLDEIAKTVLKLQSIKPAQQYTSISPSDGGGWCECENCRKLYENSVNPKWGTLHGFSSSVTPLILEFYNQIAKRTGKVNPDLMVAGYVYYDFMLPPSQLTKMEPNVALDLAPLHLYGMTGYKPQYRAEFEKLCTEWSKICKNMKYYGASTWVRSGLGTPLGPSKEIVEYTLNALHKNNFRCAYFYSLPYDYGALHNYIIAQKMWDSSLDIDKLINDFLNAAYGDGARAMGEIYALLDANMKAYMVSAPERRADYEMTSQMVIEVYLPIMDNLEKLYMDALNKAKTPVQKHRIELFGDSLKILFHNFIEAKLIKNPEKSSLYLNNAEYQKFLGSNSMAVKAMLTNRKQGGISSIVIPGRREVTVYSLGDDDKAPVIDGLLNDPLWQKMSATEKSNGVIEGFSKIGGGAADNFTRVLLAKDKLNLYMAFYCKDQNVIGKPLNRDEREIFNNDCVEIFLSDNAEVKTFWHLVIDKNGTQLDAGVDENGKWDHLKNLNWKVAASEAEGAWMAEVIIPFAALKTSGSNEVYRVNFTRENKSPSENSSWVVLENNFFEDKNKFGKMFLLPVNKK